MNALLLKDGYKVGHPFQYPDNTEMVYSNFTARGSRIPDIDHVVFFGLQYFIHRYLIEEMQDTFFDLDMDTAVSEYKSTIDNYLGKDTISIEHIEALHSLGYLPLEIKALPEGTLVPLRVPMFVIYNTHKDFGWVTNLFETIISCSVWGACTSATLAHRLRNMLDYYALKTGSPKEFVDFQAHDFSMRGMNGLEAAKMSGAGHLLSFKGTDTIPAIKFLEKYYHADSSLELIGASVPATEHSVMCMGGKETEKDTYLRLINDIYPEGIVSIVSDTWDFWKMVTETLPEIKDSIMQRNGKLVIRPDSGNPINIICGDPGAATEAERKGLIECLWDTFGGTETDNGYLILDEHIGAIYGDAITYDVAEQVLIKLEEKNFASCNIVFGIGSYTYQYNTRDTFGFAMKATAGIIDGEEVHIFKDPKTDNGLKKSAKGFLKVVDDNGELELVDNLAFNQVEEGLLTTVFSNGIVTDTSLTKIRERLNK